jgi:hypothetical protein
MGYLTPVLVSNDAVHLFKNDDGTLSKKIYDAVCSGGPFGGDIDVSHEGYCNYITVKPSQHSSEARLMMVSGGNLCDLNPRSSDVKELKITHTEYLEDTIARAKRIIAECEMHLKSPDETYGDM